MTAAERLRCKLTYMQSGCLVWTGNTYPKGYGYIAVNGKTWSTHRLAWTLASGPIPPDMHVLHHCDNPPCCQTEPTEDYPEGHLFLGTNKDNVLDRDTKGRNGHANKTHCPKGHLYDAANTYLLPAGRGAYRQCKTCTKIRDKARSPRKRK